MRLVLIECGEMVIGAHKRRRVYGSDFLKIDQRWVTLAVNQRSVSLGVILRRKMMRHPDFIK
jgi:hypothetical protein